METSTKAHVIQGWNQEPATTRHDSLGWWTETTFRLNGIVGVTVQTGPSGGSPKSTVCYYDPNEILKCECTQIGYMLGFEAKVTKSNIEKAHLVALEHIRKKSPEMFPPQGPAKYRIQHADGTIKNAGTDKGSWFNLKTAREQVDMDNGERIVEHDGMNILWEVL